MNRRKRIALLLGDPNDTPDSPFYQQLQQQFLFLNPPCDKTYPADAPECCIDHIAIHKPAASPHCTLCFYLSWVGQDTVSDHLSLHAKMGIDGP